MYSLTQKQKEAVESSSPATLVIAGPGTGKTHILAARIQHLVEKQSIKPENILCLSFTESAANAMRERVISFLGTGGYKVDINTFHGFSSRLIDEHPELFGYRRDLKALTDIDRAQIIQKVIDELYQEGKLHELVTAEDKYFYYYDIASALSLLKREGFSVDAFQKETNGWQESFNAIPNEDKLSTRGSRKGKLKVEHEKEQKRIEKNKELALIYSSYQQRLQDESRYDYEDMILQATRGILQSDVLQHDVHERYRAILVDEYQDTNGAQNKLLFSLIPLQGGRSVFVVGDDDQAIHRFQGATVENFAEFTERFSKANIVSLEDNFRSPQHTLDAALALAGNNTQRITSHLKLPEKTLQAHGEHAALKAFNIIEFSNDLEEHAFLIQQIQNLHEQGSPWGEIAVLTRTNKEQGELANLLRHNGIPATISAEHNALTEPRTASLLTLAQACMNPLDDEALLSFLRHPATPITTENVYRILANRRRNESIYEVLRHAAKKNTPVRPVYALLNELNAQQEVMSGAHWLQEVIERTGFLNWLIKQKDAAFAIANIRALTDEAKRIQEGSEHVHIADLIEHFHSYQELGIALKPATARLAPQDTVRIMTAHHSKGQEFENVFLVHAVDGHWSGKKTIQKLTLPPSIPSQKEDEEDARRLFYVALTRTKKHLYVSYAHVYTRGLSGAEEKERQTVPAVFVTELSDYIKPTSYSQVLKNLKIDTNVLIRQSIQPPARLQEQKEVVRALVSSPHFALNATSLNAFLECPQKFLFENVLRVPKVKTFSLTYGEAIHLALERYFSGPPEKQTLDGMMETIQRYLDTSSTLTERDNQRIFERANETLIGYFPKLEQEPEPLAVEYRFPRDEFTFDGIRLSGKIDKLSPLLGYPGDPRGVVKVVDYKTSKKAPSLNAILGKTQDERAPNLLRQLLFYKLLLELDAGFKHTPEQFALDFVDASREVLVPLDDELCTNFKNQLKKVWNDVQTLKFLEERCDACGYCNLT